MKPTRMDRHCWRISVGFIFKQKLFTMEDESLYTALYDTLYAIIALLHC